MKYIYIGKIVNTHGIKGEIRLLSRFKYKNKVFLPNINIYIGKEKNKEIIQGYRKHKKFDMITLKGYSNINEVLKYKNENVYVLKDEINFNDNEYLDEDLIGLSVVFDNKIIGKVSEVSDYNNKILVVNTFNKEILIPMNDNFIKKVDFKKLEVVVELVEGMI